MELKSRSSSYSENKSFFDYIPFDKKPTRTRHTSRKKVNRSASGKVGKAVKLFVKTSLRECCKSTSSAANVETNLERLNILYHHAKFWDEQVRTYDKENLMNNVCRQLWNRDVMKVKNADLPDPWSTFNERIKDSKATEAAKKQATSICQKAIKEVLLENLKKGNYDVKHMEHTNYQGVVDAYNGHFKGSAYDYDDLFISDRIQSKQYTPVLELIFTPMRFVCFIFMMITQYKIPKHEKGGVVRIHDKDHSDHHLKHATIISVEDNKCCVRVSDSAENAENPFWIPKHNLDPWNVIASNSNGHIIVKYGTHTDDDNSNKNPADDPCKKTKPTWILNDGITLEFEDAKYKSHDGEIQCIEEAMYTSSDKTSDKIDRLPCKWCAQTPNIKNADIQLKREEVVDVDPVDQFDSTKNMNFESKEYEFVKLNLLHPDYFMDSLGENMFRKALGNITTLPKKRKTPKKKTTSHARRKLGEIPDIVLPRHITWQHLSNIKAEQQISRYGIEMMPGCIYDPIIGHFYPQRGGIIREVADENIKEIFMCGTKLIDDTIKRRHVATGETAETMESDGQDVDKAEDIMHHTGGGNQSKIDEKEAREDKDKEATMEELEEMVKREAREKAEKAEEMVKNFYL